jgi:hypothetical protein
MTVRLALLGAVDTVQADAFRVLVVEDFEGIAVEDPDDEAMILRDSGGWRGCQDSEEHTEGPNREATEGAKDEGHGSLAGRRIVGANQHTCKGLCVAALRIHAEGSSVLFGQCGIYLAYLLLDL